MDAEIHWEETLMARLEYGFSSLDRQFTELKAMIGKHQSQSVGLLNAMQRQQSELSERSVRVNEQPTSQLEHCMSSASENANDTEGDGKVLASSTISIREVPTGSVNSACPVEVEELDNAAEESGQEITNFKLHNIWDPDDVTLKSLEIEAIARYHNSAHSDYEAVLVAEPEGSISRDSERPSRLFSQTLTFRKRTDPCQISQWILHPQSRLRLLWDMVGMLLLCYDFMMIPMQAFDLPDLSYLIAITWTTRLYWTLDIPASFLTGYLQNGRIEMRFRKIAYRYSRSWLVFDVLIVLPEWISLGSSVGTQGLLRGARSVRFLRLLRLAKVQRITSFVEERINSSYGVLCLCVLKLLAGLVMLLHFFACAWYWIGQMSSKGWVRLTNADLQSLSERYIICFQWSLHQFHPSSKKEMKTDGTLYERLFMILSSLMGLAVSSVFVSSITNTMLQLQILQEERTKQLRAVRQFILSHYISLELAVRAKRYVKARLEDELKRRDENQLLELLPEALLADLHEEARRPILCVHSFFSALRTDFPRTVRRLCHEAMREIAARPGDVVFHAGDVCKRSFFVWRGDLRYHPEEDVQEDDQDVDGEKDADAQELEVEGGADNDQEPTTKSPQRSSKRLVVRPISYLSEATLWTSWEHTGSLRAKSKSELLTLNALKFAPIIKETPLAFIKAVAYARKFVHNLNTDPLLRSDFIRANAASEQRLLKAYTETLSKELSPWRLAPNKEAPSESFNELLEAPAESFDGLRETKASRSRLTL